MFSITATEKPRWYNFRWKLSNVLVKSARLVYPENPEVNAFFMKLLMDQAVCGKSVVRVDPSGVFNLPKEEWPCGKPN